MTLIINDDNYLDHMPDGQGLVYVDGKPMSQGMIPRDYSRTPYGRTSFAKTGRIQKIPMEEWPERIEEMERTESGLYYAWKNDLNSKILDQNGIPYCHAYSPAIALMLGRAMAGLPYVEISAGSIGGPVTNYRPRGAWIGDNLEHIVTNGAASTEYVPMDAVKRNRWKPGADENALLHRVEEWDELGQRDFEETMSALLQSFPVCVGLNWWGHAVTYIRPVDTKQGSATSLRRYRAGLLNSWGARWGEGGYAELEGNKRIPDEQYVPRVNRPSVE